MKLIHECTKVFTRGKYHSHSNYHSRHSQKKLTPPTLLICILQVYLNNLKSTKLTKKIR